MASKILIIGGVATGPKAASRACRRDHEADIKIIERGHLFSYAGCGMPFYIEGLIDDIQELLCTPMGVVRDDPYFKSVKDIDVIGKTEAVKIDRKEKTVTVRRLDTGEMYDLPYDKLVLAVGASAFVPRMKGVDLNGVYRLYNPSDAEAIRQELDAGASKVAIIGGGLIGMEVCGSFVSQGCEVTVLEMMDQLVPALLDSDMAQLLEKYLLDYGVQVHTNSRVDEILDDGSGRVSGVQTANGSRYTAEMVLVAIGVRPNIKLAKEAGLHIGETGAISVNQYLQTSDPNIYAGGDCVENVCLVTGRKVYVPLGSTANKHGRVIGDNITGGNTVFPGVTSTTVFKVMGYNVGSAGISAKEAERLGYEVVTSTAPSYDCAHYYPKSRSFILKLVADSKNGRLLGAQALGQGEIVKRVDVIASCLKFGAKVKDVADMDLGYAPPYSTAIDPVAHAANIIRNKIDGLARGISAADFKDKIDGSEDFVVIDVRSFEEVEENPFDDHRVQVIPVPEVRSRLSDITKDKEIIVLCSASVRAYEVQRLLSSRGFEDVKFLDGGLTAWPYPL